MQAHSAFGYIFCAIAGGLIARSVPMQAQVQDEIRAHEIWVLNKENKPCALLSTDGDDGKLALMGSGRIDVTNEDREESVTIGAVDGYSGAYVYHEDKPIIELGATKQNDQLQARLTMSDGKDEARVLLSAGSERASLNLTSPSENQVGIILLADRGASFLDMKGNDGFYRLRSHISSEGDYELNVKNKDQKVFSLLPQGFAGSNPTTKRR